MKYQFIEEFRSFHPVEKMCHIFDISRSGYYQWQSSGESRREQQDNLIVREIRRIRLGSKKKRAYGAPRLAPEIKALGIPCGKNKMARIMRQNGIKASTVRKFKATTDSNHDKPIAANLLAQNFLADRPDQVWVTDITYVWTEECWLYLAVILDVFSRLIVGWSVSDRLKKDLVLRALNNALTQRNPGPGLIFHSDKGIQYASRDVRDFLSLRGFRQSMSGLGNCYDNAMAESFFHSLKVEHIYFEKYATRAEGQTSIFDYIELFYNRERRHSSLGYLSPVEFEKQFKMDIRKAA